MKILSAAQIREIDQQTIAEEPIASIDLMERASRAFTKWLTDHYPEPDHPVLIFAGPGNNGGDALAIARLLHEAAYPVQVYICRIGNKQSPDCQINEERLRQKRVIEITEIKAEDTLLDFPPHSFLIDGLFGSGLSRPVSRIWGQLIEAINNLGGGRIAIDIPSGLFADAHSEGAIIKADYTISFQVPKLAFFLAQNAPYVGQWSLVDIGLLPAAIEQTASPYHHLQAQEVSTLLRSRGRFDHKGTFGHALIVAGSHGKIGAAILSARAALRSGCGLLTAHLPRCGYEIMQVAFPEAMVQTDKHRFICSQVDLNTTYAAIGVGPGLGTDPLTAHALGQLLEATNAPVVLDADALNILAQRPELQKSLPAESVLTPHPKEFERLFGPTTSEFARLDLLRERAEALNCYIVLKGGYSALASPDGQLYFSTAGNPGMGTAGSGDVLTGVLTGLLAQGYSTRDACMIGIYLHALAGDIAAEQLQQESLIAEDIIQYLGSAFAQLRSIKSGFR